MPMPPLRLSVVVVPLLGGRALGRLLDALRAPEMLPEEAEILVLTAGRGEPPEASPDPRTRWIEPPAGATVPARRVLGALRARGEIVALLEDTTLPDPGWGRAVVELHGAHSGAAAIGGTLRLSTHLPPAALALSLLEYGPYLRGGVSEAAGALAGNNLSFKRAALAQAGVLGARGLHEAELIPRISARAGAVRLESAMSAAVVEADPKSLRLSSRFQHARLYAGRRLPRSRRLARLARAAATPLLPAALLARCISPLRRTTARPPSLRVLAHVLVLGLAWSAGEAIGYLWGEGDAEESWV
jgi:hypothetical protein